MNVLQAQLRACVFAVVDGREGNGYETGEASYCIINGNRGRLQPKLKQLPYILQIWGSVQAMLTRLKWQAHWKVTDTAAQSADLISNLISVLMHVPTNVCRQDAACLGTRVPCMDRHELCFEGKIIHTLDLRCYSLILAPLLPLAPSPCTAAGI